MQTHTISLRAASKNNVATAALVRAGMDAVPASARMAASETRIEIIPIRERERTRATNRRVARKSHNTRESNSVLEAILRSVAVPLGVFSNRSAAQRKARTTANGRIISKNPAK